MGSSCRPQSELRPVFWDSLHLAVSQPFVPAIVACLKPWTKGCETARWSESQKAGLSSDWGLQLDPMKSESLVIADQQRCGGYVPGPCTHRPSRHESRQHPKPVA